MAEVALVLRAERWMDIVMLSGSQSNIDAPRADSYTPPAGIGDLAIMEMLYDVSTIDVFATAIDLGIEAVVLNQAGDVVVDIIGVDRVRLVSNGANALRAAAYFSPDPLVLLRAGEKIHIVTPEFDTDATPTADSTLYVKAVRVQQPSGPAAPIQLVR